MTIITWSSLFFFSLCFTIQFNPVTLVTLCTPLRSTQWHNANHLIIIIICCKQGHFSGSCNHHIDSNINIIMWYHSHLSSSTNSHNHALLHVYWYYYHWRSICTDSHNQTRRDSKRHVLPKEIKSLSNTELRMQHWILSLCVSSSCRIIIIPMKCNPQCGLLHDCPATLMILSRSAVATATSFSLWCWLNWIWV